jgi:D-sedoheptulose 7-phosphate isomerase
MMTSQAHIAALESCLQAMKLQFARADVWGAVLAKVLPAGARLLVAGNGGSAAQAQHLTAELVGRYQRDRRPFSAIALHAETSTVTAVANDFGFEEVFARGVRAHGRRGDVLLVLSTSGASSNLISAVRAASEVGMQSWALTGPAPNPLGECAHDIIAVPSADTAVVQEIHLVSIHLICSAFDRALSSSDEGSVVLR